ncbi:unnamed protein product [Rhizophagus irregularis]|nr:unnamed protein product [Rhizophagus irregularis]
MNFLISLWQLNDFVPYRGILKIQHNMLLIVCIAIWILDAHHRFTAEEDQGLYTIFFLNYINCGLWREDGMCWIYRIEEQRRYEVIQIRYYDHFIFRDFRKVVHQVSTERW